ncbi:MAG TPA: hypothetical protein VHA73_16630 [Acidimicrobiales bacterium]|nr:hypothetical protein [Acidimicrobiales bacterium]
MTALIFLAIPVVIIVLGGGWLWFRHHKPRSLESGVESFRREMRALSPEGDERKRRAGQRPGGG